MPGRGALINRAPLQRYKDAVDFLCEQIHSDIVGGEPFVLFGHSLGALLALGVAWRFSQQYGTELLKLVVSACRAPQLCESSVRSLSNASQTELVAHLDSLGGLKAEILASTEFMDYLLPIIRADRAICKTFTSHGIGTLGCPIKVLLGESDYFDPNEAQGWTKFTEQPLPVRTFAGSHFYIDHHTPQVIHEIIV